MRQDMNHNNQATKPTMIMREVGLGIVGGAQNGQPVLIWDDFFFTYLSRLGRRAVVLPVLRPGHGVDVDQDADAVLLAPLQGQIHVRQRTLQERVRISLQGALTASPLEVPLVVLQRRTSTACFSNVVDWAARIVQRTPCGRMAPFFCVT